MARGFKTGGRTKNTPNKVTGDIKEAYRLLINENISNMGKWINKIAIKDPAKAFNIIIELSEYVIPKLARSDYDLQNNSGTKINVVFDETSRDEIDYSKLSDDTLREILAATK
jgi:hypothetical protein